MPNRGTGGQAATAAYQAAALRDVAAIGGGVPRPRLAGSDPAAHELPGSVRTQAPVQVPGGRYKRPPGRGRAVR